MLNLYITNHSSTLYRYQGEDVSIGIWLDESKKQKQSSTRSSQRGKIDMDDLTYIQASRMITNGGTQHCGVAKYMMIGHDLNVEEIYDCHMKFSTNTAFVDEDNAWLDDPAEWKQQIRQEEEFLYGGSLSSSWYGGGLNGASNDDIETNNDKDYIGRMTSQPTQEQ